MKKHSSPEETLDGVRLTHPDKLLYPQPPITKRDLAIYYRSVAKRMLPYAAGRPLTIVRCPEGVDGERFFQKHPNEALAEQVRRISLREKSSQADYAVVDDVAGLVALAQVCALEIHVWGSRADNVERPDQLIFDLDPAPEVTWKRVLQAAAEVRHVSTRLGAGKLRQAHWRQGSASGRAGRAPADVGRGRGILSPRGASHRARRATALRGHDVEGEAQGQDLRRLPAQSARRHRDRAVFDAGPCRRCPWPCP